ncbi:hypothetical protein JVU11DRAFT_11366 [Chiua virens]|nr:hypothetical protein JVU11DRAFT_11366 [Chiua virens]
MDCINPTHIILKNGGAAHNWKYTHCDGPVHPGAMRAPMPQYYALPDQRRIEHIPRPAHLSPPYESIPAVTFSVRGWPGVRVKDILKDTLIIDSAGDSVFEEHGWRSTVLNLEWPGYDARKFTDRMRSRIDVRPGGENMTRHDLAREICGILFNFHQVVSKYSIAPGFEKWALTAGPEGIRVPDVILLSIHYYRNMWVPEFYVIE